MRAFWHKCIGFRCKDHCEKIIVHRGGGENASKCFLHDLDHWAAHKVFNLSPLCEAELIFLAAGLNSICAKLQGEIYAWNPPYSLFSLFLCSLIPPPCMTLLYRHWFTSETPTWCTISSGLNTHSWTYLRKDAAWMCPPYLNVNSWEIFLSPPGDHPPPKPSPTPALLLCNSIPLPVFLCLPKTQMLTFWQSLTVRHVCHWQTLLKDERKEKERFFPPQIRIPRSRIILFRLKTFFFCPFSV